MNAAECLDLFALREKIRDAEDDLRYRVRELREAGVSRAELAEVLSISPATVSRYTHAEGRTTGRKGRPISV